MEKIRGTNIILDGEIAEIPQLNSIETAAVFYEVIRCINGKLLFVNDHLKRLSDSCKQTDNSSIDQEALKNHLHLLIDQQQITDGNIKILIYITSSVMHSACFFIPHSYPGEKDYSKGVKTKTFRFERPDPNIKKWNESFRTRVNKFIDEKNIYEAILENEQNKLTEGSRSNLFFVDSENNIVTAPLWMILPGITRKYILQLCTLNSIPVIEKALTIEDAAKMKNCFITGTSPKILPVNRLNELEFPTNGEVVKLLMNEYDKLIFAQLQE